MTPIKQEERIKYQVTKKQCQARIKGVCEGCGCHCHHKHECYFGKSPCVKCGHDCIPSTPEPSEWEKEFDEKYGSFELCERICKADHDRLKEYISTLLTQQREELIEKIEKMKQQDMFSSRNSSYPIAIPNSETTKAYNEALDDILNSLKGERKEGK